MCVLYVVSLRCLLCGGRDMRAVCVRVVCVVCGVVCVLFALCVLCVVCCGCCV